MSLLSGMTENSWVVMFVQHSLCPDIVLHDVFEDMTSHRSETLLKNEKIPYLLFQMVI